MGIFNGLFIWPLVIAAWLLVLGCGWLLGSSVLSFLFRYLSKFDQERKAWQNGYREGFERTRERAAAAADRAHHFDLCAEIRKMDVEK